MVLAADVLSQLRRGALEYCVLALLADEERYGFDIVRTLGSIDGMVTGEGTLYPLLSRLKKDGHVTTTLAGVRRRAAPQVLRHHRRGPPRPRRLHRPVAPLPGRRRRHPREGDA